MKLVIAEKPSVAMSLAAVLGATERKDGYLEGSGYLVSWCVGHLLELAQPEAYKEQYAKWRYEDLPILPENWKYEVPKDKKKQLALLCRLMKDKRVDSVVCATDAGREGELIFRLVYEYAGCNKPMERLWISSMEDAAIREGFDHLRPGSDYDKLYDAAVCRAGADWLIGINATRLFSVLYGVTLNVGRVMSPTLALLVQRESDIESFISKPFYVPEITCGGFTASGEKMTERSEAEKIRMDCDHNSAFVRSVEKQVKTIQPPRLYDLTTLQRECNRIYGYTAQQTLDYVQSLYEKKLATYPRTDSQYLTKDMQATAASLILWLRDNMPFGKGYAGEPDIDRVTDDSKVTDHHAIKVFCGCCDHAMSLRNGAWFYCRHSEVAETLPCHGVRIKMADLEQVVFETIRAQMCPALGIDSNKDKLDLQTVQQAEHEEKLRSIQDSKRHLYEQYALGEIDLETYRTRKAVYDTELVQAKNVHAVITAQTKQIKSDYEIKLKQQEIMQEVGNANMLTKALIDRLINKVYVFPGERIEIEYATQDFLETKESEKEV